MTARITRLVLAASAVALLGAPAFAQTAATDTDTQDFTVIGNVPSICFAGTVSGDGSVFDLGVLVDTTTGFLRTDLSAPPRTLTAGFCNALSSISVTATPMTAQAFTGTPPAGFSRTVNYTAQAAGWTTTPASFSTGSASNPAQTQARGTPFAGDITVSVDDFLTGGGDTLRLVADTSYLGTVTVTLAVAN